MHTEEKINETEMLNQKKKRNCPQKCFHSFNYVIDTKVFTFLFVNTLHCFYVIPSVLLAASFQLRSLLVALTSPYKFYLNIWIFYISSMRKNRQSQGVHFKVSALHQTWLGLPVFNLGTSLPKKYLDTTP